MITTNSPAVGSRSTHSARIGAAACDALITQIQSGDRAAAERFRSDYSPGARILFEHHLGKIGLHDLVAEMMNGAVEEIKRGTIRTSADWTSFVRAVLIRHKSTQPAPTAVSARAAAGFGAISSGERRILARVYVEGRSMEEIRVEFNLSAEELQSLMNRWKEALRTDSPPRMKAKSATAGVSGNAARVPEVA
jgi:hypothetical protein